MCWVTSTWVYALCNHNLALKIQEWNSILHFQDERLVENVLKDNNWNVDFASQEVLQLMDTGYCK